MPHVIIRHKVRDFGAWKSAFDEHGSARAAAGCKGGKLFRIAGDPNHVLALLEWDDLDRARKFAESEDLKKTMEKAGVVDAPVIHFIDLVEDFAK